MCGDCLREASWLHRAAGERSGQVHVRLKEVVDDADHPRERSLSVGKPDGWQPFGSARESRRACTCTICAHVFPLERRLQLLLDQERYAKVEAEARAGGRSVAAVIREAVDYRFDVDAQAARRSEAARRFLELARGTDHAPPLADWAAIKQAMGDELAATLDR